MHQIAEFLSFTIGLVATIIKSLYGSLVGLLPAWAWVAAATLVFVLVVHSRLSSRIEDLETTLVQLDAKLDAIQSRLARARDRDPNDRSRS